MENSQNLKEWQKDVKRLSCEVPYFLPNFRLKSSQYVQDAIEYLLGTDQNEPLDDRIKYAQQSLKYALEYYQQGN